MKKMNKILALLCAGVLTVGVGAAAGCQPKPAEHNHNDHLKYVTEGDEKHHQECTEDDYKTASENHTWGTDNKCSKCGQAKKEDTPKPVETTITLDKTTASVEEGETVELTATTNSDKVITAASSDTAKATVKVDGKKITVTGVAAGSATITVTVDSKEAKCTVTVTAAPVASLSLDKEYVNLEDDFKGDDPDENYTTAEIEVTYTGKKAVTATVDDTAVATAAYADGKVTLTKGTKYGKATLTVTDGEASATCVVELSTYGLVYGSYAVEDEDGEVVGIYLEVSNSDNRTSTNVYIPGYHYDLDAEEYLPVAKIKGDPSNHPGSFNESNVVSVYTGDNVELVEFGAFWGSKELTTVKLGPKVKVLDNKAFQDCEKLSNLDWGENPIVNTLGQNCFLGTGFVEITIPKTVTKINSAMFQNCPNLEVFRFLGNAPILYGGTLWGCYKLKEVWLDKSITKMENLSFYMPNTESDWSDILPNYDCHVYYNGTQDEWNAINIDNKGENGMKWISLGTNTRLTVHYNANFDELLAK